MHIEVYYALKSTFLLLLSGVHLYIFRIYCRILSFLFISDIFLSYRRFFIIIKSRWSVFIARSIYGNVQLICLYFIFVWVFAPLFFVLFAEPNLTQANPSSRRCLGTSAPVPAPIFRGIASISPYLQPQKIIQSCLSSNWASW